MHLTEHLATQVIITPSMSPEELDHEFTLMVQRNNAASDLVKGHIDLDQYEDILYECGIDPIEFEDQVMNNLDNDPAYGISH